MVDDNDGTGGGDGGDNPGDGRREWPEDHRIAFAELERDTMVSVAEMKSYAAESRSALAESRSAVAESRAAVAESKAAIAGLETRAAERENRIIKWMVALAVGGTTILGVAIGLLALFPRGG